MKINQNVRHFASRKALELPVVSDIVKQKLVDLHTRIFLEKADEAHREERRERLDAFFDATMDTYLAALQQGAPEAEAREITHIQANFDFYNHGWTEMMEFPSDELDDHYDRYREFFERHGIAIEDPLGEFEPAGGIPDAPSTPEKLDEPEHPYAEGGFADDVYVQGPDGEVRVGGQDEPEDVSVTDAPGVSDEDAEA
ncbi:DUF6149 family protein [Halorussus gelatinilyticus]|uniref:DUF6149 family protein n=1 Tax=Halorussus gelatinilyticus TaxID=2937524 RepID=A0A8U0IKB3_9EURY|nr:DUF6149 family protein [Halorussus gelatinilyticus]UPW01116.1 DUF6149 family protein [Halorussus gelatinilyticus]